MSTYNILHVLRPAEGGMREHVYSLLKNTDRQRFSLGLACPPDEELITNLKHAHVRVFPIHLYGEIKPWADWKAVNALVRLIRENDIHILHAHGAKAGLLGLVAAQRTSVPATVVTLHNFIESERGSFFKKAICRKLERKISKGSDRVVTVSRALAGHLCATVDQLGKKIVTIYNGIDLSRFRGVVDCENKREELGLQVRGPVVGVVARLIPEKGVALFMKAIPLILDKIPLAQFLIIGEGPQRRTLERAAKELGIREKTIFAGRRTDVPRILPILNVLVVPSLSEGLSIISLEGMAARRPVVAFEVGGIPEVLIHGETGLLIPKGDYRRLAKATVNVLQHPAFAEQLGRNARCAVEERFQVKHMVDNTQELYEDIIVEKGLTAKSGLRC